LTSAFQRIDNRQCDRLPTDLRSPCRNEGKAMIRSRSSTLVVPALGELPRSPLPSTTETMPIPHGARRREGARTSRRRQRPAIVAIGAVGLALVVAGCGSAASTTSKPAQTPLAPAAKAAVTTTPAQKAPAPAAKVTPAPAAKTTPAAPKATPAPAAQAKPAPAAVPAPVAPKTKPTQAAPAPTPAPMPQASKAAPNVPQNNGGDADPDNNGGTDDGDGGI
jgi:hypothetical protein